MQAHVTPVKIKYTARTLDGEIVKGIIYTLSSEQMRDATEQILDTYPKEEITDICLTTTAS